MSSWNELFRDKRNIKSIPQPEVYKFVSNLEQRFPLTSLRIWDLCCGGGRHTVAMADLGVHVYASDISKTGITHTKEWLARMNLKAEIALSDMARCPWPEMKFYGILAWDAIHHNTIANIRKTVKEAYKHMVEGGMLMATLKSVKADLYGIGREIEPHTFIREDFDEKDPHHYFDERRIRDLFKEWQVDILAEQIVMYKERGNDFHAMNPFPYTTWDIMVSRPRR